MCFSCWLNLDFLWSFFGPVCIIITVSDMGGYHCWRKSPENSLFIEKKSDVFQINIFFFIITVWKLAQKFSSLNPDLNSLQKIRWVDTNSQAACAWLLNVCVRARARELFYITASLVDINTVPVQASKLNKCIFSAPCRAFVITAVAQLCVLGTMWIFGCFQFGENTIIMSYLFTIFGSLQGVMLFVMHCLFSKQVGYNPLSSNHQVPLHWC